MSESVPIKRGRKRNDDERQRIMRIACRMFQERGYNDVTTRQIAAECGISLTLLQHYFSKKEHLAASVYVKILLIIQESSVKALFKHDVARAFLYVQLFFCEVLLRNPFLEKITFTLLSNCALTNQLVENRDTLLPQYAGIATQQQELGMYVFNAIHAQMISLLRDGKCGLTIREAYHIAADGYCNYLLIPQEERGKLISEVEQSITDDAINNFISLYEQEMKLDD